MDYISKRLFPKKSELDQIIENDKYQYISTSLFVSNPIFIIKKKDSSNLIILKIEKRSSFQINYLGVLTDKEFNNNIENIEFIAPGREKNSIIALNSKGDVFSFCFEKHEKKPKTLRIINVKNVFNIRMEFDVDPNLEILDFKPIYLGDSLIGIVFVDNSIEMEENLWIFIKKNGKDILSFSTFSENEFFILYDTQQCCHLFFLQENQLWYLKFSDIFTENIEDFATILTLDESQPKIHDIFLFKNFIYIRTNEFLYKYHSEFLNLEFKKKTNKIDFLKKSYISSHLVIVKSGKIEILDDPELNSYNPVLIDSEYNEIKFKYKKILKIIPLFNSDLMIIKTQNEIVIVSLFFDRRITFQIKKKSIKSINFFEQLAQRPEEFRERIESQLSFLKRSVEIELDQLSYDSKTFQPPKIIQFFTKEEDIELLNNLYENKTYGQFSKDWSRNPSSIYFHIKGSFDIPRCEIHPRVDKTCSECQSILKKWRKDGLEKVESKTYRQSLAAEIFHGDRKDYYTAFIKRKYYNRLERTFEFFHVIPKHIWEKTIEYLIPLSMIGQSFDVIIGFGLHEILENHYNNQSFESITNDPLFPYFLIIDKEFHKYWKPRRINQFIKKHKSYISTIEKPNHYLRIQQLFIFLSFNKIKEKFISFIDYLTENVPNFLKKNYQISNSPRTTIVAGLFGRLQKLLPNLFLKKYTQYEISNDLQITEVTLRKAINHKKYALLSDFISECWNRFKKNHKEKPQNELNVKNGKTKKDNNEFLIENIKKIPKSQLKTQQKRISNFFSIKQKESQDITTKNILEVLSDEWKSLKQIISELSINDLSETRSLKTKLKELEAKEIVLVELIKNKEYWKLKL